MICPDALMLPDMDRDGRPVAIHLSRVVTLERLSDGAIVLQTEERYSAVLCACCWESLLTAQLPSVAGSVGSAAQAELK